MKNFLSLYIFFLFIEVLFFIFFKYYLFLFLILLVHIFSFILIFHLFHFFINIIYIKTIKNCNKLYFYLIRFNNFLLLFNIFSDIKSFFFNLIYYIYTSHIFRFNYTICGFTTIILSMFGSFNSLIVYYFIISNCFYNKDLLISGIILFIGSLYNLELFSYLFLNLYLKLNILIFLLLFLLLSILTVLSLLFIILFNLIRFISGFYYLYLRFIHIKNSHLDGYIRELNRIFSGEPTKEEIKEAKISWYLSKWTFEDESVNFLWKFIHKDSQDNTMPVPLWVIILSTIFVVVTLIIITYFNTIFPYLFPADYGYLAVSYDDIVQGKYKW